MKKLILGVAFALSIIAPAGSQEDLPPADSQKISAGGAALLNLLPGFGLGSFRQGDTTRGRWQLILSSVGWGWMLGCNFIGVVLVPDSWEMLGFVVASTLAIYPLGASGIIGILAPYTYGYRSLPAPDQESPSQEQSQAKVYQGAIFYNVLVGFGLGSFLQGDKPGGTFQLLLEGSGLIVAMAPALFSVSLQPSTASTLETVGMGIIVGSYAWGVVRPIWYELGAHATTRQREVSLRVSPCMTDAAEHRGSDIGVRLEVSCTID